MLNFLTFMTMILSLYTKWPPNSSFHILVFRSGKCFSTPYYRSFEPSYSHVSLSISACSPDELIATPAAASGEKSEFESGTLTKIASIFFSAKGRENR